MPDLQGLALLANGAGQPRGTIGAVVAALLAAATCGLVLCRWHAVRQTTLAGAAAWSLAAVLALAAAEAAFHLGLRPIAECSAWRFLAACLSLCPIVAILGAKRPQHLVWNFVVLSLWGIVALPAVQSLAMARWQVFELADARGWLLWLLIALPILNYGPTRFVWSAVLVTLGQVAIMAPHLPLVRRPLLGTDPGLVALACFCAAAIVAVVSSRRVGGERFACDRLWLDLRDTLGLFWSLRFQERFNAEARRHGWDLELGWRGFHDRGDGRPLVVVPPAQEHELRQTLRGLARRFVSSAWIAARLGEGVD